MKTRSMKRAEAKTWSSLPSEIRLMILEKITCQKFPRWAYLTSVSREWQQVLEKVNFSKIKLELSCLDAFVRIVVEQRRMLVRHICLNLELPKYRPITSSTYVSRSEDDVANIQEVIWQFWRILSDWEPAGNLTLELNMYSPSDRQYWFKNIYLFSDEVEDVEDPVPDAWRVGTPPHDPKYGWVRGQQVRNPPATAKVRLFRLLKLTFDKPLPKVPAVTRFVMRRQLRRFVSPTVLGPLLSTFDHLEHISYEPWMTYPYIYYNGDRSKDLAYLFQSYTPSTLRTLTIFEDAYKFYDSFPTLSSTAPWLSLFPPSHGPPPWGPNSNPPVPLIWPRPDDGYQVFCGNLAEKSRNLQHLAISFMVNAENFFRRCQSEWTWPRLESLALTSQLLQNDWEKQQDIPVLLCRARAVVQQMPRLHTFVLWNGGKGHACAFIYQLGEDKDSASITWRGTWKLELRPAVVKSWQRIVSNLRVPKLRVNYEKVEGAKRMKTHGDAIYHLKLPCQVVEPASLWQIRREGYSVD